MINLNKRLLNRSGMGILNVVFIIYIILGILLVGDGILSLITKVVPRAVRGRVGYETFTGHNAQLLGIFYIIGGLLLIILVLLLRKKSGRWFLNKTLKDK
jgi:hypothetical protein